jgi:hypothetical protein
MRLDLLYILVQGIEAGGPQSSGRSPFLLCPRRRKTVVLATNLLRLNHLHLEFQCEQMLLLDLVPPLSPTLAFSPC